MGNFWIAFLFTLIAGLATGVGSLIAFFAKKTNKKFLSLSLGFSAGVMIYVSFMEIMVKAKDSLVFELGEKTGVSVAVLSFFAGMFLIGLIDKFIPKHANPHEIISVEEMDRICAIDEVKCKEYKSNQDSKKLMRAGFFTALAIAIHNFPEGLATFVTTLQNPTMAIPIVVAIAIHNIPEGIAVSVPIYHATGNKKRAFVYSFLSGMSEPVGAVIGYLILMPFITNLTFGILFGLVAGIMVFISLDELLPAAREYGEHHLSIYGLVAGMALMAISLLLFL